MRALSIITLLLVAFIASALAQDSTEDALLTLSVGGRSCALTLVEAADDTTATPMPDESALPDYPVLTLGDDCDNVQPLLRVSSNGTLWLALAAPDEDEWQRFEAVEDDPYPPQLDRRGRYVGCTLDELGEQVCRVLWTGADETYQVEIPVVVGDAYVAPTSTAEPATPAPTEVQSGQADNGQSSGGSASPTDSPPPPPPDGGGDVDGTVPTDIAPPPPPPGGVVGDEG